jgi:uncharacterized protein (TIGR02145 family)
MAWTDLAYNQMVSFTDAQSGGFRLLSGQSVDSNQCMTKSEALEKYNLIASNMDFFTDSQLVPKFTWISSCINCIELVGGVTIGSQTWDKCNLNVTTYSDGEPILHVTSSTDWPNTTIGAWCHYDNDPANDAIYGKLYNWYAVAGIYDEASRIDPAERKSLAPVGKSIPTNDDWEILINELGGFTVAGARMKEEGTCHWEVGSVATNDSGFTALGAGSRYGNPADFTQINQVGAYWSATTEFPGPEFYYPYIAYLDTSSYVQLATLGFEDFGLSVRCLATPTITTTSTTTEPVSTTTTTTTADLCPDCTELVVGVIIGSQTWDQCNLNVTTYSDGEPIQHVEDPEAWANTTIGAWCYYDNDPANDAIYGKLYNWYAVAGIYDEASRIDPTKRKSLAPVGKSIPTDSEWTALTTYLNGSTVAGGKLKETGFCHWRTPNEAATDEVKFTALPGGFRNDVPDGATNEAGFADIRIKGHFWSSSDFLGLPNAWNRILFSDNDDVQRASTPINFGKSVRCLRTSEFLPVTGLTWTTTTAAGPGFNGGVPLSEVPGCESAGWVITNNNLTIRFNVAPDGNCQPVGSINCMETQLANATATITVGDIGTNLNISWEGMGEREATPFDKMSFILNGVVVSSGNAPGGQLGCAGGDGPIVQTIFVPGPYFLAANTVNTLVLDFTTADAAYHSNSYYEANLSFT